MVILSLAFPILLFRPKSIFGDHLGNIIMLKLLPWQDGLEWELAMLLMMEMLSLQMETNIVTCLGKLIESSRNPDCLVWLDVCRGNWKGQKGFCKPILFH